MIEWKILQVITSCICNTCWQYAKSRHHLLIKITSIHGEGRWLSNEGLLKRGQILTTSKLSHCSKCFVNLHFQTLVFCHLEKCWTQYSKSPPLVTKGEIKSLVTKCVLQEKTHIPHRRFFLFKTPILPEILHSSLASYFPLNIVTFKILNILGISNDLPWDVYWFFRELQNADLCLFLYSI